MRKKILIVDDDQLVLYGLTKALQNEAIDVTAVATATAALGQIAACFFDLCLVDIHLPDFCGIELMQQIKATCPEVNCIVMTASCTDQQELSESMQRIAAISDCHFLPKPFELSQMRDLVLHVLQEGKRGGNQATQTDKEMLRSRRKSARRPYHEQLVLAVMAVDNSDTVGPLIMAKAIDISAGGIGILCDTDLGAAQNLILQEIPTHRTGAVIWSKKAEHDQYQAGIQFA